jgi:sarcosine oxidase subunit gamma
MRTSPLHDCLARLDTVWGRLNDMPVALRAGGEAMSAVQLFDLCALHRTGLKGTGAAPWLQSRSVGVPERANCWCGLQDGALIARLGRSEFLIEDGPRGTAVSSICDALATPVSGVYPVLRQDAALMLRGEAAPEVLAQTCGIDLSGGALEERAVSLTTMAGISVIIIDVSSAHALPCYRIWCDGTYGRYLWETLLEIAIELGGGAAGLSAIYPDLDVS